MARIDKSIEINTTPDKIWEMIYWDKIPEWLVTIKKAEYTSENKDGVGATAHINAESGGVKAEWDVEVTEYEKNEKAAWRTTAGNFTAIGSTFINPTEAGTKIRFIIDYDLPYSILGEIIDKLVVGRELEKDIEEGLKKLKNILEK